MSLQKELESLHIQRALRRQNRDVFQLLRRPGVEFEAADKFVEAAVQENQIGPFEFDYLIDKNWAAKVADGDGTEGQEFETFHGHTFLIYSEPLAAAVHATANRTTSGQGTTFFIVGGDYTLASKLELKTGGTFQVHRWIGSGPDRVTLLADANSMSILSVVGEGSGSAVDPTFYIEDIGFDDNGKSTVGGIYLQPAAEVHIKNCRLTMSGSNRAIDVQSGDTRGTWIEDCYLKGSSSGQAIRIGALGATSAPNVYISRNEFVGGWGFGILIDQSARQIITGNHFNLCGVGIAYRGATFQTESVVANNIFVVGSTAGIQIRQANPNSNANIVIIANSLSGIGSGQEGIDVSEVHASSAVFAISIVDNTFAGEGSASAAAVRGNATANKVVNSILTGNIFRDFVSGTEYPDWDVGPGNEAFHNISTDETGTPHPKQVLADIGSPVGHVSTAADIPGHTHEDASEGGTIQHNYGNMYAYDVGSVVTISGTGIANKEQVTAFAVDGESLNTTPDHTNDHITIDNTGKYLVTVSMAVDSGAGTGFKMGYACYKNNGTVLFNALHGHRDMASGGSEHGSMVMSGIVALTAGDTLEVWVWNETNTTNITVDDISLSVVRVGD